MKNQINIAINGFGRIGRAAFKISLENPKIKVAAINDLTDSRTLAHLLKYDSVYGVYDADIKSDSKNIYLDGVKFPLLAEANPAKLPWRKLNIDVVLECTGRFTKDGSAGVHLRAGAKKVLISAPAKGKGNIPTYLIGVNSHHYKGEPVISMASCTTNSIGAITKIIHQNFGLKQAYLTTVHSYTSTQNLVDGPHKDLRRARAAAFNIIPTTTGAAIALSEALPAVKDKFDAQALRVPTICGSISDLTYLVRSKTTSAKLISLLKKSARSKEYKNVLAVSSEPLVSADIIKTEHSAIVDLEGVKVLGGNLIKIMAWYDNEWAYAKRLLEMTETANSI